MSQSIVNSGLSVTNMSASNTIRLILEGEDIECCKDILCKSSDYFKAMFSSNMSECQQESIVLHDASSEAFKTIWNFCQTGSADLSMRNISDVIMTSHMFQFTNMFEESICYVIANLNCTNCLTVINLASRLCLDELYSYSLSYATYHILEVVECIDSNTHFETLALLLKMKELDVDSEALLCTSLQKIWSRLEDGKLKTELFERIRSSQLDHNESLLIDSGCEKKCIIQKDDVNGVRSVRDTEVRSRCYPHDVIAVLSTVISESVADSRDSRSVNQAKVYRFNEQDARMEYLTDIPIPTSTFGYQVIATEQFLYVVGGELGLGSGRWMKDIWRYDSWAQKWAIAGNLPAPIRNHALCADKQRNLYVAGGFSRYRQKSTAVSKYSTDDQVWTTLPDLPVFVYQASLIMHGNTLYACTGFNFYSLDLENPREWQTFSLVDYVSRDQQEWLNKVELPSGCFRHMIYENKLYFIAERIVCLDLTSLEIELLCDMSFSETDDCIPELREPYYYHIGHHAVCVRSHKTVQEIETAAGSLESSHNNPSGSNPTESQSKTKNVPDDIEMKLLILFAVIEKDDIALHAYRYMLSEAAPTQSKSVIKNIELNEKFQKDIQMVKLPKLLSHYTP